MDRAGQARALAGAPEPPRAQASTRLASGPQLAAANDPSQTTAPAADRRNEVRREPDAGRALAMPPTPDRNDEWFPSKWPFLMAAMIAAIGGCLLHARAIPGIVTIAELIGALVCAAMVERAYRTVPMEGYGARLITAVLFVLAPLFLFALGMATWTAKDALDWSVAIGVVAAVGAIAATYLRRFPPMIVASQLVLYAPVFADRFSLAFVAGLLVSILLAVLVAREQLAEQRATTQQRAAQERAQTRARDILADYERTQQGWFWETDRRGLLSYLSVPVAEALGRDPDRMIGQSLIQLFDLSITGGEGERTLMFHLSARSAFKELSVRAAIKDEERWWSISGRPIYDQFDNFVGFRGSGTDLTERKRSQDEVTRLANYDSLTGLANRFQMSQSLEKILKAPHAQNRACTIFLLDLDRFKHVNDTLGHPAGDALLQQVAQRLECAVDKLGQVGRLGGDEFKVLAPGRLSRKDLGNVAEKIIESLSQPYTIDGQRVTIGASIGIAVAPDDGETSESLIRNADLALYAAKDGGRGRFHFYAQDLHAEAEARSMLEHDLRDAISQGDLELHYQPIVTTATEQIAGFEALLRWHHPVKGWIPPQKFVESAEDSGMIEQLGEWALRTACRELAEMGADVRVAVNVSPLQFANPRLPAIVTSAIAQAGICPSQLELEITESVFLADGADTDAMFAALKNIGVRLALDDFGTGYSSLGYLKKAPFDKIKIDQSFVRGATEEGSRNGAIIASITSLAHALGMETTAEGVETVDELDMVRMYGCSHVQGYIYDRPLDAATARERLATGLKAIATGPRTARSPRHRMLRKVVLDHGGNLYNGTIRNISTTGALIEGLWNVPEGTIFKVQIAQDFLVTCTARWCHEERIGVEFANPLQRDSEGRIIAVQGAAPPPVEHELPEPEGPDRVARTA